MVEELKNQNPENSDEQKQEGEEQDQKKKKKIKFGPGAIITVFMISIVCFLIIGYFYTWPNYSDVENSKSQIQTKQNEIEQKNEELAYFKKENERIANLSDEEILSELRPEQIALRNSLPVKIDVPDLIRDMDYFARLAQDEGEVGAEEVFLSNFNFGNPIPVKEARLIILPINASLSSHTFALMDYMKILEDTSHRIVNVKAINISYAERDDADIALVFLDDKTNTDYQNLLKKRSFYLLTDSESEQLKSLQEELITKFNKLRYKANPSETDLDYLTFLQKEVERIQKETSYNVSMETYFNMSELEAQSTTKK